MAKIKDIQQLVVVGINYKKTDASLRGKYAVAQEQYTQILQAARAKGVQEIFVLSTCNRTELYAFAESTDLICNLLCSYTEGDLVDFLKMAYIKRGVSALQHLFNVAAGLDSQILGDYEIVGQLKQTVKFAKAEGCIGAYLDRIINAVLQASKEIKNHTELSSGTVSVSFAAVQYIKQNVAFLNNKRILLIGTGKIGRNTCKNLIDYLDTRQITLINRTTEKAAALANELGLAFAPADALENAVSQADIILVATNAPNPVILSEHVVDKGKKWLIDLSIPNNIDRTCAALDGITLVNVDELSKIKDETLQKRIAEVPKAEKIIADFIQEYLTWHEMRKHVPVLKAIKSKLEELNLSSFYINYSASNNTAIKGDKTNIQRVINNTAVKLREQNQQGCHFIEAINEYISFGIS